MGTAKGIVCTAIFDGLIFTQIPIELLKMLCPDPIRICGEIRAFGIAKTCRPLLILEIGQIAWVTGAIAKHDNRIKTLRLGGPRHGQAHEQ